MRNSAFIFFLSLVLVLTVFAAIIYGFDITTHKNSRRALTHAIKNQGTSTRFYKINHEFAFGVFLDREPGERDILIHTYDRNVAPFCLFCGWYTEKSDDNRYMNSPYLANEYAYSKIVRDEDWGGVPANEYPVFNLKTGEFSHVKDLKQLPNFPTDSGEIITREYVSENYDEISYFSHDDEDCMAVVAALMICYVVLGIWGIVLLIRSRTKTV